MTEWLHFHFSLSCIGEGNGNPLHCSCLENPRDGGAWWTAVYGVAQSWTRLKQLSSSSSTDTHADLKLWSYVGNSYWEYREGWKKEIPERDSGQLSTQKLASQGKFSNGHPKHASPIWPVFGALFLNAFYYRAFYSRSGALNQPQYSACGRHD